MAFARPHRQIGEGGSVEADPSHTQWHGLKMGGLREPDGHNRHVKVTADDRVRHDTGLSMTHFVLKSISFKRPLNAEELMEPSEVT